MKKTLALILALVMMFTFAACAATEETPAAPATDAPAGDTAEVPAGDAEETPAVSDEVIKLGVAITQTGPQSSVGTEAQRGMEIAIAEINAAGGINGMMIEPVIYDEQGTPEGSLKAVTRLVEQDEVDMIFGPLGSNSMMAVGEYLNEAQVVTMGPPVSPAWLQQGWEYLFRPTSNTYVQAMQMVALMEDLGVKTLGIYNINEEYGNTSKNDLVNLIAEQGLDIEVVVEEVYKDGDTDFTAQSVKIADANPDAVVMVAWANDVGSMMKQLRQGGYTGAVIGDNSFPGLPIREVAGAAMENAYCTAAYILPDTVEDIDTLFTEPMINSFLHAYYDAYGELPTNDNCYRAYDSIYILAEAVKQAGSKDGPAVQAALSELHDYERIVGTMDYRGNNGEGIFSCNVYKFEDGKLHLYEG